MASLTYYTLCHDLLAVQVFQKLLLVLAEIVSQIVHVVINLLLEALVVSLTEVNDCIL